MRETFKMILLFLIVGLIIINCNSDGELLNSKIIAISPDNGPKGTIVTITGKDFGTNTNLASVFFNGKKAELLTLNNTEITVKIPPLTSTGLVTVNISNNELIGPKFRHTMAIIESNIIAGSGIEGSIDGVGIEASFKAPIGLAIDSQDNIFVTDTYNHKIRKITPSGVVTTIAGSTQGFADGITTSAKFNYPYGIAIDSDDNLYITDSGNSNIRKITSTGIVSTIAGSTQGFADGIGTNAKFYAPTGIVITKNNTLYVVDQKNNRIRKITPSGEVSTFSGSTQGYQDGDRKTAKYYWPAGITIDAQENLYISDTYNNKIRKISTNGNVSSIAGSTADYANGVGTTAQFYYPLGLTIDTQNVLYIADYNNDKIRKIDTEGNASTVAGSTRGYLEGTGSSSKYNRPFGLVIDSLGNLLIADTANNRIRKIIQ